MPGPRVHCALPEGHGRDGSTSIEPMLFALLIASSLTRLSRPETAISLAHESVLLSSLCRVGRSERVSWIRRMVSIGPPLLFSRRRTVGPWICRLPSAPSDSQTCDLATREGVALASVTGPSGGQRPTHCDAARLAQDHAHMGRASRRDPCVGPSQETDGLFTVNNRSGTD